MGRRLLGLGWRNLWRNPRRTCITMAAIALGYSMLLFVACLMAGLRWQMIENGTGLVMSQVQVHAPTYYPGRSVQKTLGGRAGVDVDEMISAIRANPLVRAAAPRVYGYGLLSATHRSAGVELLGIRPEQEREITQLSRAVVKGRYVTEDVPNGLVVGDTLAATLAIEVGSEVVVLTNAADGSMGNDVYEVVGMFHSGLDAVDRGLALMPLASLQDLLHLSRARIHEIGITLNDVGDASALAAALTDDLAKFQPVRARAWPELAPELASYVEFNRGVTLILLGIFFLMAVIGVMNTLLMAVFERTRELGMLMALGMRPAHVIALIVAEAAGLAAASLAVGAMIGAPLLWYLQANGLNVGGAAGDDVSVAGIGVGHLWYGRQDFPLYGRAALGLAASAIASALYPAWRAARCRPTEALRKV